VKLLKYPSYGGVNEWYIKKICQPIIFLYL